MYVSGELGLEHLPPLFYVAKSLQDNGRCSSQQIVTRLLLFRPLLSFAVSFPAAFYVYVGFCRECCLPLLQHCLDSEDVRDDAKSARLLKLLLGVTLASTPGDDGDKVSPSQPGERSPNTPGKTRGEGKDEGIASSAQTTTQKSATPPLVFQCQAAEDLLHRSLRTPGQVRTFALQALGSFSTTCDAFGAVGEGGAGILQRRQLLTTLVDVGLDGGDGSLIAAAASALGVIPGDVAALVGGLVPSGEKGGHGDGGRLEKVNDWPDGCCICCVGCCHRAGGP